MLYRSLQSISWVCNLGILQSGGSWRPGGRTFQTPMHSMEDTPFFQSIYPFCRTTVWCALYLLVAARMKSQHMLSDYTWLIRCLGPMDGPTKEDALSRHVLISLATAVRSSRPHEELHILRSLNHMRLLCRGRRENIPCSGGCLPQQERSYLDGDHAMRS